MADDRDRVTFGGLCAWAAANQVPGASVLKDPFGRLVADFWVEDGAVEIIASGVTDEGKTLGDLMKWAAGEDAVEDAMPVVLSTPHGRRNVVRMTRWPDGPQGPYVALHDVQVRAVR